MTRGLLSTLFLLSCAGFTCFGTGGIGRAMAARSGQAACWTRDPGEAAEPGYMCRDLSESTLNSLKGLSPAQVVAFFGTPGGDGKPQHFQSMDDMPGHYTGYVDLTYRGGQVAAIDAMVAKRSPDGGAGKLLQFRWVAGKSECSDFPGSRTPCAQ